MGLKRSYIAGVNDMGLQPTMQVAVAEQQSVRALEATAGQSKAKVSSWRTPAA